MDLAVIAPLITAILTALAAIAGTAVFVFRLGNKIGRLISGIQLQFSEDIAALNVKRDQAHQVLASTKEANAHDIAINDLSGIGDEAFALSNDSDSHLIMARKGAIIMRLQVKRAAGNRSLEELKAFAERVFKPL